MNRVLRYVGGCAHDETSISRQAKFFVGNFSLLTGAMTGAMPKIPMADCAEAEHRFAGAPAGSALSRKAGCSNMRHCRMARCRQRGPMCWMEAEQRLFHLPGFPRHSIDRGHDAARNAAKQKPAKTKGFRSRLDQLSLSWFLVRSP
jgi:hypothetical protein